METPEIEPRNLLRNWNYHNFSLECPIQAHHILRCLKLNNGSSREIQMVISYYTEVRFRNITYWDARNWTTEAFEKFKWSLVITRRSDSGASYIETLEIKQRNLSRNSNGQKLSHGCPIQAHHISRRSKLNNVISRDIQMVISYHTEVRLRNITYRATRNWTTEALEKLEWS